VTKYVDCGISINVIFARSERSNVDLCDLFGLISRKQCMLCPKFLLVSPFDQKIWTTKININCNSHNIIYAIQCRKCKLLYVGQTSKNLKTRFSNHFYDITNKSHTFVSTHFNLHDHHKLDDVEIFILAFIPIPWKIPESKARRLHEEAMWQHRLHSLAPHGLNTLDENRVRYT